MDPFTFPFPRDTNRYCHLEQMNKEYDLIDQGNVARDRICVPKCMFSRSCGKRGAAILDCDVVKEAMRTGLWDKN